MDDYLYQEILNSPSTFYPTIGYRYVDIEISQSSKPVFDDGGLLEGEISAWVQKGNVKPEFGTTRLRLLLAPRIDPISIRRLPFLRETYEEIAREWAIPPCFVRTVVQHVALGGARIRMQKPDGSRIRRIVLKSEVNWPWEFALAVVHDVSIGATNCLCIGLHDHEMLVLIEYLRASTILAFNELLVPMSILDLTCQELSKTVDHLQVDLWNVQNETGLHGARINDNPRDLSTLNLDNTIRQLTAIADYCTRLISRTMTLERLLTPIEAILRAHYGNETEDNKIIQDHIQLINQTIAGSQHYIKWYQSSTESQVQTVPKPLTTQQEICIWTENV